MKYCKSINSNLVSIRSNEEMEFLKNNILIGNYKHVWIGGSETDGKWSWVDGSKFDWKNWEASQPNAPIWADSISDCAYLWKEKQYLWADARCDSFVFPFICKSAAGKQNF